MKFYPAKLPGAWLLEPTPHHDDRGLLARTYCEDEFRQHGLNIQWPQCNLTLTHRRGSVRGMHFQADPHPETKLIRCSAGAIFDVIVDIRRGSGTFGQWQGFELTAANRNLLYVPDGFAHGMQCLVDNCEVFYHMSTEYRSDLARGIHHDDSEVGIKWRLPDVFVSQRDLALPPLSSLP